jgi:hypothetical protein
MEGLLLASFFFGLGCNGGDKVPDSLTDSVTDSGTTVVGTCYTEELDETYSQYVEPFVSGSVPSSCSQCHMTGIDLSLYAQDTPCETMACMVDLGVVDLWPLYQPC